MSSTWIKNYKINLKRYNKYKWILNNQSNKRID
mgnify:CR=1 FL=1